MRLISSSLPWLLLVWVLPWIPGAQAQVVVHADESLASHRPETWAMNYVGASTFMTAFGETLSLAPGSLRVAADLGHVPRLDEAQQRVGLGGIKQEDLNKSPVFGRLRLASGLPGGFVAELGYTPPFTIRGAKPLDLIAVAIGRRIVEQDRFTLSLRAFGQHGRAVGDITCPARLAGFADPQRNPYGCRAPSRDVIDLGHQGIDLTAAYTTGPWHAHAGLGVARTQFAVQVDALTVDVHDRSRLVARGSLPFAALGAVRDLDAQWSVGVEVLHVPLRVQRDRNGAIGNDPLTSLRMQLGYRFG